MKFLLLILIVTANAAIKCPEKATSPICGMDRDIYANACQLEESTRNLYADWNHCKCSEPFDGDECTDKKDTVCGSDGKTYKNRCHLLTASCENNGTVYETDDRPTTCKIHDCPKTALQPVCGFKCSNPIDCFSENANKQFTYYANPCQLGNNSKAQRYSNVFCDCYGHGSCPPDKTEVCGNDKKMYKNRCHLIHSRCKNPKSKLREVPTECCKTKDKTTSRDCL